MKETVAVLACMLAMFGAGMFLGSDNITYNVNRPPSFQKVDYVGEIQRGYYRFIFVESIEPGVLGRTWPHDNYPPERVLIKTGRPAGEILETCRHELLHHFFPEYNHPNFSKPGVSRSNDPIYRLDNKVDLGICKEVVSEALIRQKEKTRRFSPNSNKSADNT